jgi:prepilin-type processing-associated H-X9-DG protein
MFRNNSWRGAELKIVLVMVVVLGFVLQLAVGTRREKQRTILCQSYLKQIGLASRQYVKDYDERCPLAGKWSEELMPYLKNAGLFDCPKAPNGYAMNQYLSGVSAVAGENMATMPFAHESTLGVKDAHDTGASWPSPPRHGKGNNMLFFDGHVQFFERCPAFPKIPVFPGVNYGQAIQAFKRAGWSVAKQNQFFVVMSKGQQTIVVHRANPIPPDTMADIVQSAGLTLDQFRRLLAAAPSKGTHP